MPLDPLLNAAPHIQFHALAATLAVLIGPVALYRKRRDKIHKITGYVWVTAMFTVAVSSFFIHSFAVIGPFSPLHGLAVLTLWSLWKGVNNARAGRIRAHQDTFRNLYWLGLMIAGLANFMPGRMINKAVFGGNDSLGWIVIGIGTLGLIAIVRSGRGATDTRGAAQPN